MAFSFNFNDISVINYVKNGVTTSLDKLIYDGVTVWESFNTAFLMDFEFNKDSVNKKAYLTAWKGTYNGVASTTCYVPDNSCVNLYKLNFRSYSNNITNIYIGNNVSFNNTSAANMFNNMRKLTTVATLNYQKLTNMYRTYYNCRNLTGSPVCGENVTDMYYTYSECRNLTGSPVCGKNVTSMVNTYYYCSNLTGSPVCGKNVTSMSNTYYNCSNLTGSPVCGENVTDMYGTYFSCSNLTGSPVCGKNVTSMAETYWNCSNLTGSPVCGNNVTNMYRTYAYCSNLTGSPVCGENVTSMHNTYRNCRNLSGNAYFYSNKLNNVRACFNGKNNFRMLNIYVPSTGYNSTHNTLNTCLYTNMYGLVGTSIKWTSEYGEDDGEIFFNTVYNIYIYPVSNVAAARAANGD